MKKFHAISVIMGCISVCAFAFTLYMAITEEIHDEDSSKTRYKYHTMRKIEYDNHSYVISEGWRFQIMHDPGCKCLQK